MTRPRVVVLDYGFGNIRSAHRALARAGAETGVTADYTAALNADGLVVPGVGAFAACMGGLRSVRGDELIARRVADGRPVLGICVGMQVLFAKGAEHGVVTDGCGLLAGTVDRLDAPVLPHMGWNTVDAPPGSVLFAGLGPGSWFYFVHSYAVRSWEHATPAGRDALFAPPARPTPTPARAHPPLVTWAEHGDRFVAAAEYGPLSGTQFHPEKSGDAGAVLLRNWLGSLR
jgi:imidazole glycerol-phosphate synthase subunit HisH